MKKKQNHIELAYSTVGHKLLPAKHRITRAQLQAMSGRVAKIVNRVEAERAEGAHRYRDLPYDRKMLRAVQAAVKKYKPRAENLVVLGIGGSALGNIALQQALNPLTYNLLGRSKRGGPRLFVLDNVDPHLLGDTLDLLKGKLNRTMFNVISKSGETAETMAQFLIVRDLLRRRLGAKPMRRQMLVTTDRSSGAMRSIVDAEGYELLEFPEGVGGRFSVLSAVGLFSAGMCGIDIAALLKGAADMDERVRSPRLFANPAALLAAIHVSYMRRGKPIHVMMPYANQLYGLADWYRQIWAESLGKRWSAGGRKEVFVGPTPVKALGTTDQHSQVQLYRQGPNDKVVTFLEVGEFARDASIPKAFPDVDAAEYLGGTKLSTLLNTEKRATEKALLASGRPCLTIKFPRISAQAVGQFIYLYEAATTLAGRLLGIDPYDQPGVELGKRITFHLMGRRGYRKMPMERGQRSG